VEVIALLGFTPVIAEVDPATFNIDPDHVRSLISAKTKAIMPVHLFGQCCDMEAITDIAEEYGLSVIEDNAQSIGAVYRMKDGTQHKAGTIGDIGTTSFYPSKNIGAYGDGGAVCTNDSDLAELMQSITNHGMGKRYYHDRLGVNSRLDTLQAAVLLAKLKRLDQYISARQAAAAHYDRELAGIDQISIPARNPSSTHVFHQYTIKVEIGKRDALKDYLEKQGIPSMIYYPVPTQHQKAFAGKLKNGHAAFPVTDLLCAQVLSLPMHSELREEELQYICNAIRTFFQS
jgi:dTDP-4-amino-4,6-dideoxygalactose transaminase